MNIRAYRKRIEPSLLRRADVTGISNIGRTLRIYVTGTPEFPARMDNFEVEVIRTGLIRALSLLVKPEDVDLLGLYEPEETPWIVPKYPSEPNRMQRYRPVVGGCSIGHPSITAGTHGVDLTPFGFPSGLSNNHVLAAASTFQNPNANIGDPIYQPGVYDGGGPADEVGTLQWYMPIDEEGGNLVDAALWRPHPGMMTPEIIGLNQPMSAGVAKVGDILIKSGRTTGITSAEVQDVNATIKVDYGTFQATFTNQIVTNHMADGGDSGSADLDESTGQLKGLLFAGSPYVTVHNHIGNVFRLLGGGPAQPRASSPFGITIPSIIGAFMTGWLG